MPSLNCVHLIGHLTRDVELKYTPKGTAIANIGLAINRAFTLDSGEKREEVTFVDCEAYGKTAEILGEYVKKGDPLFVDGRLRLDQWEKEGEKRSKMKVVIEGFQFLGGKREGERGESAPPPNRPPQAPRPPADPDLDPAPDDIPFSILWPILIPSLFAAQLLC